MLSPYGQNMETAGGRQVSHCPRGLIANGPPSRACGCANPAAGLWRVDGRLTTHLGPPPRAKRHDCRRCSDTFARTSAPLLASRFLVFAGAPGRSARKPWLRCQAHSVRPSGLRLLPCRNRNADQAPPPEPCIWHGRECTARSAPAQLLGKERLRSRRFEIERGSSVCGLLGPRSMNGNGAHASNADPFGRRR